MKVTIKMIKQINKLYDNGQTMRQLAKTYNLSKDTVANYVWNPRKSKSGRLNASNVTTQIINEINTLYNNGNTMKMVAKTLKLSSSTIGKCVINARNRGTTV